MAHVSPESGDNRSISTGLEVARVNPFNRADVLSGFLVFLIALPLCLAIAKASLFPPIAGIWTAVIGGLVCTFISNSQMTIKGPAAGLIVIVAGAVMELCASFGGDLRTPAGMMLGYKLALGIGVASGICQILFGLLKLGKYSEMFPSTPVHGMLASIGLIVIAKQAYAVLGADAPAGHGNEPASPLTLLANIPAAFSKSNPEILLIGGMSLLVLFSLPFLGRLWKPLRLVPAQLVVIVVAIAMGLWFDLDHEHKYLFPMSAFAGGEVQEFVVGPKFLVTIPHVLDDPLSAFAFPDFRGLGTLVGMKYLLLFALIGSLESVLSAKAVDLLDPQKRKTSFDRDLIAIGVANTAASCVGGLPMISEIVRSSANISNGARSSYANMWHGLCLLAFVLIFPGLIHSIPLAALAAMLVYTGFRLASPTTFVRTYRVGSEQLAIFVVTIIATLATDLLIGIATGIGFKLALHLWHSRSAGALLAPRLSIEEQDGKTVTLALSGAVVFSNWLRIQRRIHEQFATVEMVVLDMTETTFVDHSVMEKLHEQEADYERAGKCLKVIGLDDHTPFSAHPLAARKKPPSSVTPVVSPPNMR
ncbi:MAG: sulfate transporter [Planctomyces sp.]|nr:sulfate transporter [Planctomyces sp.]